MNKTGFLTIALLALTGLSFSAQADDIATNTARMQAMDKITGKVTEIDVPVGGIANYGSFSILVRKCVTRSPEEAPESTAFVDVADNYDSDNPVNIFKGWMFASSPALSAVEHPIYDVWLLKCYNREWDKSVLLTAEQLALRDELPMHRMEKVKVNIGEIGEMTDVDISENKVEKNVNSTEENSEDIDFASEGEEDEALNEEQNFNADITIGSSGGDLLITVSGENQAEE